MAMTLDQIAQEALNLPNAERAILAERLTGSLDTAESARIDQLWAIEARRRRNDVRTGMVKTIPGEDGLAQIRRALER